MLSQIKKGWNSTIKSFSDDNPTQTRGFRLLHFLTITITFIVVMSLIGVGILSAPMYEGNRSMELIMTSIQYFEPLFAITALLLLIKGKRSFYWYAMSGISIVLVTQVIQGMWMGVIRAGIQLIVYTITYIRWGKDTGGLVVQKASWRVWIFIVLGFTSVAIIPGILIQQFAGGTIFEPPSTWHGWLDSITFSFTMMSLILNIRKYREARLLQFVSVFFWPVILFSSQIWLFAVNSLFFSVVGFAGFADWWYRSNNR